MGKLRFNKSIYFEDKEGKERFLFKILNFGDDKEDHLKFNFKKSNDPNLIVRIPANKRDFKNWRISPYSEITYHNDGEMHFKYHGQAKSDNISFENPYGKHGIKRIPLYKIQELEPIIELLVNSPEKSSIASSSNKLIVPFHKSRITETSFRCVIMIVNKFFSSPKSFYSNGFTERIRGVGLTFDLLCLFEVKTKGSLGNSVRIIEQASEIEKDALVLDLYKINGGGWNTDFMDMKMNLKVELISNYSKKLLVKAPLNLNTSLIPIYEEIGKEVSFKVLPRFKNVIIQTHLVGFFVEREEKLMIEIYTM